MMEKGAEDSKQLPPNKNPAGAAEVSKGFILHNDLAKFLAESTKMPNKWEPFFGELEIPEDKMKIAKDTINSRGHKLVFADLLESWISNVKECNVELLCEKVEDSFCQEIAGKGKKTLQNYNKCG